MRITVGLLRRIIRETAETMYPTWDELPKKDQIASIYSDVYKEKYGIRPRWMKWDNMTDEEAQAELDRLYDEPGMDWDDAPDVDINDSPLEGTVDPDEPAEPFEDVDPPSKIPMRGGNEYDALSRKGKNVHIWRPGQRAAAKRSYNRRLRHAG